MKVTRILGLVATAAIALTALIGASSALAVQTTLCKTAESPYCKSENRYPKGTALQASSSNATFTEYDQFGVPKVTVQCSESTLKGETTAESGEPLSATFSSWTFGGCKTTTGVACTVTAAETTPYSGSLSWVSGGNGALTVASSGKGNPRWYIKCLPEVHCQVEVAANLDAHGGLPMSVVASEEVLTKVQGALCYTTHKFSGTYTTSGVSGMWPARAQAPPAPTTGLCKAAEEWCDPANLYPSGTALVGKSSNVSFQFPEKYGFAKLTCGESEISAKTTAAYGEPLPLENSVFALNNCKSGGLPCTMSTLHTYTGSVKKLNGDGLWNGGEASWHLKCTPSDICTFTIPTSSTITIEHGTPGTIRLGTIYLSLKGTLCPEWATVSGDFPLTSPAGVLVFTDVVR